MKNYAKFKKNYFFKMFKFLLTFFIDLITPVISSTQIACDVMCVQHVIKKLKNLIFTVNSFFCRPSSHLTLSRRRPLSYRNQSIDLLCKSVDWFLYDNGVRLERVKSNLSIKNLNEYLFLTV